MEVELRGGWRICRYNINSSLHSIWGECDERGRNFMDVGADVDNFSKELCWKLCFFGSSFFCKASCHVGMTGGVIFCELESF